MEAEAGSGLDGEQVRIDWRNVTADQLSAGNLGSV